MAKRPENPTPKKQLQRARVRQLIKIEKMYNAALEGYARELGLLIHSWNDLHIELTQLFLVVCRDYQLEEERDILLAVWNAIPNERLQREMLRQAARVRQPTLSNLRPRNDTTAVS
jgi:siroheme synthase (precorrin-2 oxidase/ferrochelatase)